jgi:hypothetical protein
MSLSRSDSLATERPIEVTFADLHRKVHVKRRCKYKNKWLVSGVSDQSSRGGKCEGNRAPAGVRFRPKQEGAGRER